MSSRLSITEVAKSVGVTPRTIMRWEKNGKIKRSKRDWRGWRFYLKEDVEEIKRFYESSYEYNYPETVAVNTAKAALAIFLALGTLLASYIICSSAYAAAPTANSKTNAVLDVNLAALPVVDISQMPVSEAVKYTLGPDDVIDVEVRRHPEFSGQYAINSEGKIEYKYVGDIIVSGLTKNQLKERLSRVLSEYIIEPDIDIRIAAYLSKVFYVVGEVNRPGKFYMRGDIIGIREALVQAGLPTLGAAMRRCRLITPDEKGSDNYKAVNVYKLLYGGDLKCNLDMKPGDVLYVPSTIMAKIIHIISPVTTATSQATTATAQSVTAAAVLAP